MSAKRQPQRIPRPARASFVPQSYRPGVEAEVGFEDVTVCLARLARRVAGV
jgi:hypothetical protein